VTVANVGDREKYRQPIPPPRPEWCFCEMKNGGQEVCGPHKDKDECSVPLPFNWFDHESEMCRKGDHNHCLEKDINMVCGKKLLYDPSERRDKNACECRKDMEFDRESMECRIFIDVYCALEEKNPIHEETNIVQALKGKEEPHYEYYNSDYRNTFCNLLEEAVEEYVASKTPGVCCTYISPLISVFIIFLRGHFNQ